VTGEAGNPDPMKPGVKNTVYAAVVAVALGAAAWLLATMARTPSTDRILITIAAVSVAGMLALGIGVWASGGRRSKD